MKVSDDGDFADEQAEAGTRLAPFDVPGTVGRRTSVLSIDVAKTHESATEHHPVLPLIAT